MLSEHPSLPPTTTSEQDLKSAGQRIINRIWEITQAAIALTVTGATIFVSAKLVERGGESEKVAFQLLTNVFFVVIGFYFGRTNHSRPDEPC